MWEFCQDTWSEDYSGAPVDETPRGGHGRPPPHSAGTVYRVCRGGSWHEPPAHCRSAVRLRVAEDDRMEYYGLRVMLQELG